MQDLVGMEQNAFIRGRSITDNILLVQEIAHSMSAFKRNKSIIILKVDIEKAFDCVSWEAIINALTVMNFPVIWISWIKAFISSPAFSCLVNGNPSGWFRSNRDIRQGDPLSPFLFVLVMKIFSCLINCAVNANRITPFKCKDFKFSHAIFADDLIIALRANKRSIAGIKSVFQRFKHWA